MKKLREDLIILTEGQSLGYLVDFHNSRENLRKAAGLFKGVHLLYIEASFEASEAKRARERNHLTSAQAGALARWQRDNEEPAIAEQTLQRVLAKNPRHTRREPPRSSIRAGPY